MDAILECDLARVRPTSPLALTDYRGGKMRWHLLLLLSTTHALRALRPIGRGGVAGISMTASLPDLAPVETTEITELPTAKRPEPKYARRRGFGYSNYYTPPWLPLLNPLAPNPPQLASPVALQ